LRRRLEAATANVSDQETEEAFSKFLRILADLDDMDIDAFFRRLTGAKAKPATTKTPFDERAALNRLRAAFSSDDSFHQEMTKLAKQRSATKPVLTRLFYSLFERTRGVPAKATRDDLLRLIEDERNISVRNEKMGQMLGRRIVPAE
jgi:hypothetical protein